MSYLKSVGERFFDVGRLGKQMHSAMSYVSVGLLESFSLVSLL